MVLTGDAELRVTGFENFVPLWEASSEITVVPATDCNDEDPQSRMTSSDEPIETLPKRI